MTDHANELRRYARKIAHPAGDVPSVMLAAAEEIERLRTRLEITKSAWKEVDKSCRDLTEKVIPNIREQLESAEKERDNANAAAVNIALEAEMLQVEIDALRAKVEQMEKQEPVAWQTRTRPAWNDGTWGPWRKCSEEYAEDIKKTPLLHDWLYEARALYTLPGAQNIPEKLCYDSRWEISIDYVDGWNAAVDMMRGKSPSWHCPDCCIAFPFGAPKSCPNDDARCNSLLAAAPEASRAS